MCGTCTWSVCVCVCVCMSVRVCVHVYDSIHVGAADTSPCRV